MFKRIISLAPSITETLFELGKQRCIVGITNYCNYPKETNDLTKIGAFNAPDLAGMLALKPDLVLCTTMHSLDKLAPLKEHGVEIKQVVALKLFDAPLLINEVGKAVGMESEAKNLVTSIQNSFDDVLLLAKGKARKRVCYFCTSKPFCNWKPKCQSNELVNILGGELTAYDKNNLAESIVSSDPELIIIPYSVESEDYNTQIGFISDNPIFEQTTAFKKGHIKNMNGDLLSRPGPRAGEGLKQLYKLIHT